MISQRVRHAVRVVAAFTIVAWLAYRVGPQAILHQLARIDLALLVASLLLMALDGVAKAWNWQQLLEATVDDQQVPFGQVLTWHFAGGFLGAVVPSSASTDAFRVFLAQRGLGGHAVTCAASVVTLNGLGWFTGCVIGLIGLMALAFSDALPSTLAPAAVLFVATVLALPMAYALLASKRGWVVDRARAARWKPLRAGLTKFVDALLVFERAHVRFPAFLGVSAISLLAQAGMFAVTAAAVGIRLPFPVWMILAPLTRIVALIPVSVADVGLIQAAHVSVLAFFGVPPSQSFALSALFALQGLLIHVTLGSSAFVYTGLRSREPRNQKEAFPSRRHLG